MSAAKIARLSDRGVVAVTGADAEKLLQGLVTNDLDGLTDGEARFAGLLSPQGKILFEFFVVRCGDGYLLDVLRSKAADLVKRLSMYKLRADASITDVSDSFSVVAMTGNDSSASKSYVEGRGISFTDPRHEIFEKRFLADADKIGEASKGADEDAQLALDYDGLRVQIGIPEGGKDYEFGDAYPHEADFDLFNGVSFTKGCYVGQEVVARMQNKTIVRKRAVRVFGNASLKPNSDILLGDAPIGRIGTVRGSNAIAMLRLDRALEAEQKNLNLVADGVTITPEKNVVDRYRAAAAQRSAAALPSS